MQNDAMGKLIRLPAHRFLAARTSANDAPPVESAGDFDLLPMAGLLWIASVARVVSAAASDETFYAEATLALACVIVLPLWFLWSRVRGSAQRGKSAIEARGSGASVSRVPPHRPPGSRRRAS